MKTESISATYAGEIVARLWQANAMNTSALSRLDLVGDTPLLPTSFHVGVAAEATIACAALSANEVAIAQGKPAARVSVDLHDAERECTGFFTLAGKTPPAWAPLSGLYPARDGFVRIHANFEHHRDGMLALLGITKAPGHVSQRDVEQALAAWTAIDFETAASEAGLVVSALRSFEQWDQHPQAQAVAQLPLLTIERIGDADALRPASSPHHGALSGYRVLDLTRILAGPVCGRTLAAYGADVMLVNSPNLPNIENISDTSRGKRSVHVDLLNAHGRETLASLLASAHVFIQGYRPGGIARLGFSPEESAAIRPGLVYVTLSAYSHVGPWADKRGFDSLVQTATGFNHAEGLAAGSGKPRALPVQILDYASGFLMAYGANCALLRQRLEGGSWHVRVSLAQTAHWLRGLGRVADNFHQRELDLATHAIAYRSGFGDLVAMPHAAQFDGKRAEWIRNSNPPGSDAPAWD